MDWIITTIFLSVFKAALCFNIDPVAWKTMKHPAAGFGYQVVQRQSDLLVSAPLEQYSQGRSGQIYKCSLESCSELSVPLPDFAVNMSLGLTMTSDPTTQNTMACGPTIPKDCQSITMYSGMCFQIERSDRITGPVPSSNKECRSAEIAFLLDGSGSVNSKDFNTMKTFVRNLIRSLLPLDTKFAIAEFSDGRTSSPGGSPETSSSSAPATPTKSSSPSSSNKEKKIRVSTSDGRQAMLTLQAHTTFPELQRSIANQFGVPPAQQFIRYGFPPKELVPPKDGEENEPVVALQHGDKVTVEILRGPEDKGPAAASIPRASSSHSALHSVKSEDAVTSGRTSGRELQDSIDLEMSSLCLLATLMGSKVASASR